MACNPVKDYIHKSQIMNPTKSLIALERSIDLYNGKAFQSQP